MVLQNARKVANPTHLISVAQNTHYGVYSIQTTQPEEIIDDPRFLGKCYQFLKPLDRVQVIDRDAQVIYEYIMKSFDSVKLLAEKIKLSKIDLMRGEVTYYTNMAVGPQYVQTGEEYSQAPESLKLPPVSKLAKVNEDEDEEDEGNE